MNGRVQFRPMAITRSDDHSGCVGAVTADGGWIRPMPVAADEVEGPAARYEYGRWYTADVAPESGSLARPEDHRLLSAAEPTRAPACEAADPLRCMLDPCVEAALAGERSLGLVRVRLRAVYAKASTGRRTFLRACFRDDSGEEFDWIIPEVRFRAQAWPHVKDGVLDPRWEAALLDALSRCELIFTLGLTRPNHRMPGRFRGCHPLVVGIHTWPSEQAAGLASGELA